MRYGFVILSSFCIAFYALYIFNAVNTSAGGYTKSGSYLFSDFCHHYIISCGLRSHEAKDLYIPEVLEEVKTSVLGAAADAALKDMLVLIYPPTYLFFVSSLGSFAYAPAYAVFMLPSVLVCLWAGSRIYNNLYMTLGLLSFPATFICLVYGQTGFIVSALLVLSLSYYDTRPLLSGCCLGLALIKPQFCLLPLVAYLSGRQYRVLAATGVTVLTSIAASGLVFGFDSWANFLRVMHRITSFSRIPFGESGSLSYESMYTLYASMMRYGFSYQLAYAAQALVSLGLMIFIVIVWKSPRNKSFRMAATLISIPFATHFGYYYDLVVVYFAMLCFVKYKEDLAAAVLPREYATVLFLYAATLLGVFDGAKAVSQCLLPVAAALFVFMLCSDMHRGKKPAPRLCAGIEA